MAGGEVAKCTFSVHVSGLICCQNKLFSVSFGCCFRQPPDNTNILFDQTRDRDTFVYVLETVVVYWNEPVAETVALNFYWPRGSRCIFLRSVCSLSLGRYLYRFAIKPHFCYLIEKIVLVVFFLFSVQTIGFDSVWAFREDRGLCARLSVSVCATPNCKYTYNKTTHFSVRHTHSDKHKNDTQYLAYKCTRTSIEVQIYINVIGLHFTA